MKLSQTSLVSSSFFSETKKYKKNPVLQKISYFVFKMGWSGRSRIF
ncbi:hypothetical protein LNTAR_10336 [Lentisphaera araneosa HTCC2155]|uniref:Uncharacterized protein n=1 Tax=Lentisphaera araneosa HTCC2155 TaxID=313628 RepID=A6DIM0_9BACT|nr:hypothetical protein LNTAR_10336 [Lentisphaera araneosa HTCC2155]